jgi:uncharacterized protein (TIGR03067 family)
VRTSRSGKTDGRSGDLDALQGAWHLSVLEVDGQVMPPDAAAGSRIVITGDSFASSGMGGTYAGTVEIDPTKTPKHLDLRFTDGHAAGTRNPGIYRLDGNNLTICLATRGTTRPKTFATKPKSGLALETFQRTATRSASAHIAMPLRRAVSAPARAAQATPLEIGPGPATDWEGEWAMVMGVFGGAAMDASMVQWCRRITRGNVTSVVAGPQVMVKARFTLDRSKRPCTVDYVNLEGAQRGKVQAGIFELGGGMLTVCMAAPGKPRPQDFTTASGDGRSLTTWRLTKRND